MASSFHCHTLGNHHTNISIASGQPGRERVPTARAFSIVFIRAHKNMKNYSENLVKDRVSIYDNGIKFSFIKKNSELSKYGKDNNHICNSILSRSVLNNLGFLPPKRSKILTFSKSSRRRMRDFMLRYSVPDMVRCGVTLTLPWKTQNYDSSLKNFEVDYLLEFEKVVHRFRVSWLRRFPECGCVYRVELQKRKVPHLHLISFHRFEDLPYLKDDYFRLWFLALQKILHGGKLLSFFKYGVDLDSQLSSVRALQYLSDHSSKSKQAQLGYKGKQWGVWGLDNFKLEKGQIFRFSSVYQFNFFKRHIHKFRRFTIKNIPCVFGSKKSHTVQVVQSHQYLSSTTLRRLFKLSRRFEHFRVVEIYSFIFFIFFISAIDTKKKL